MLRICRQNDYQGEDRNYFLSFQKQWPTPSFVHYQDLDCCRCIHGASVGEKGRKEKKGVSDHAYHERWGHQGNDNHGCLPYNHHPMYSWANNGAIYLKKHNDNWAGSAAVAAHFNTTTTTTTMNAHIAALICFSICVDLNSPLDFHVVVWWKKWSLDRLPLGSSSVSYKKRIVLPMVNCTVSYVLHDHVCNVCVHKVMRVCAWRSSFFFSLSCHYENNRTADHLQGWQWKRLQERDWLKWQVHGLHKPEWAKGLYWIVATVVTYHFTILINPASMLHQENGKGLLSGMFLDSLILDFDTMCGPTYLRE